MPSEGRPGLAHRIQTTRKASIGGLGKRSYGKSKFQTVLPSGGRAGCKGTELDGPSSAWVGIGFMGIRYINFLNEYVHIIERRDKYSTTKVACESRVSRDSD